MVVLNTRAHSAIVSKCLPKLNRHTEAGGCVFVRFCVRLILKLILNLLRVTGCCCAVRLLQQYAAYGKQGFSDFLLFFWCSLLTCFSAFASIYASVRAHTWIGRGFGWRMADSALTHKDLDTSGQTCLGLEVFFFEFYFSKAISLL